MNENLTSAIDIRKFALLNDDAKFLIIQIGIEMFFRAWSINTLGWKSLNGALYYIKPRAETLTDNMLCGLVGNDVSVFMNEFYNMASSKNILERMSPLSNLKL